MSQRNEERDAVSQRCNIGCCSAKAQRQSSFEGLGLMFQSRKIHVQTVITHRSAAVTPQFCERSVARSQRRSFDWLIFKTEKALQVALRRVSWTNEKRFHRI